VYRKELRLPEGLTLQINCSSKYLNGWLNRIILTVFLLLLLKGEEHRTGERLFYPALTSWDSRLRRTEAFESQRLLMETAGLVGETKWGFEGVVLFN